MTDVALESNSLPRLIWSCESVPAQRECRRRVLSRSSRPLRRLWVAWGRTSRVGALSVGREAEGVKVVYKSFGGLGFRPETSRDVRAEAGRLAAPNPTYLPG